MNALAVNSVLAKYSVTSADLNRYELPAVAALRTSRLLPYRTTTEFRAANKARSRYPVPPAWQYPAWLPNGSHPAKGSQEYR
jgi:hypothetical protein